MATDRSRYLQEYTAAAAPRPPPRGRVINKAAGPGCGVSAAEHEEGHDEGREDRDSRGVPLDAGWMFESWGEEEACLEASIAVPLRLSKYVRNAPNALSPTPLGRRAAAASPAAPPPMARPFAAEQQQSGTRSLKNVSVGRHAPESPCLLRHAAPLPLDVGDESDVDPRSSRSGGSSRPLSSPLQCPAIAQASSSSPPPPGSPHAGKTSGRCSPPQLAPPAPPPLGVSQNAWSAAAPTSPPAAPPATAAAAIAAALAAMRRPIQSHRGAVLYLGLTDSTPVGGAAGGSGLSVSGAVSADQAPSPRTWDGQQAGRMTGVRTTWDGQRGLGGAGGRQPPGRSPGGGGRGSSDASDASQAWWDAADSASCPTSPSRFSGPPPSPRPWTSSQVTHPAWPSGGGRQYQQQVARPAMLSVQPPSAMALGPSAGMAAAANHMLQHQARAVTPVASPAPPLQLYHTGGMPAGRRLQAEAFQPSGRGAQDRRRSDQAAPDVHVRSSSPKPLAVSPVQQLREMSMSGRLSPPPELLRSGGFGVPAYSRGAPQRDAQHAAGGSRVLGPHGFGN